MGMFSKNKKIIVNNKDRFKIHVIKKKITETFKSKNKHSDIDDDFKLFMSRLKSINENIVDHPFDFKFLINLYKNCGIVNSSIDTFSNYMLGGSLTIDMKENKAKTLINNHYKETNFYSILSPALKLAFVCGTCPIEKGRDNETGKINGYKIIDPESFYILENEDNEVVGYCQILKETAQLKEEDVIFFDVDDIILITIDKIGTDCYGNGILNPAVKYLDYLFEDLQDMHKLQKRKCNSPIWWKLGMVNSNNINDSVEPSDNDKIAFKNEMEHMNEKTEFVTGPFAEAKILDFGDIGEKFMPLLNTDWRNVYIALKVPEVLLGSGSVPEGLAKYQLEHFKTIIRGFRKNLKDDLVEQSIKPYLESQNQSFSNCNIIWGLPSEKEINDKIEMYMKILQNPNLNESLRIEIEKKIAELLDVTIKENEEVEKEEEETAKQPRIPGHQKNSCGCNEITEENKSCVEKKFDENMSLKEWINFDYSEYEDFILDEIKKDNFDSVKAKTKIEQSAGKLSAAQVNSLKNVLEDAVKNSYTMKEISSQIKKKVKPKNLYKTKEGKLVKKDGKKVLQLSKEKRPMLIARTETVRVTNNGYLNQLKSHDVKKVSWLTTESDRTCEECYAMDGRIMKLNEAQNQIPLHPNCRCGWEAIVPK
jgi:SPP1 gp7 family putative phage head morphogenesis protein